MTRLTSSAIRTLAVVCAIATFGAFGCAARAQDQKPDPRKATTIQTATLDVGGTKGAVEVRYLNLPWGEKTFSYMEQGGNEYYSNRAWPVAHLKLARPATWNGAKLAPGDYVMIITPKGVAPSMTLSLASFTPTSGGTFLVPGDVFTEVPAGATEVAKTPITFSRNEQLVDHLVISVDKASKGADIKLHYGNRGLTETLTVE